LPRNLRTTYALGVAIELIEEVVSADKSRRCLIKRTSDGRLLVEVEHRVAGDGEDEPPSFWSRGRQLVTVTDTIQDARRLAAEALISFP
jgi:hypothetical protein